MFLDVQKKKDFTLSGTFTLAYNPTNVWYFRKLKRWIYINVGHGLGRINSYEIISPTSKLFSRLLSEKPSQWNDRFFSPVFPAKKSFRKSLKDHTRLLVQYFFHAKWATSFYSFLEMKSTIHLISSLLIMLGLQSLKWFFPAIT